MLATARRLSRALSRKCRSEAATRYDTGAHPPAMSVTDDQRSPSTAQLNIQRKQQQRAAALEAVLGQFHAAFPEMRAPGGCQAAAVPLHDGAGAAPPPPPPPPADSPGLVEASPGPTPSPTRGELSAAATAASLVAEALTPLDLSASYTDLGFSATRALAAEAPFDPVRPGQPEGGASPMAAQPMAAQLMAAFAPSPCAVTPSPCAVTSLGNVDWARVPQVCSINSAVRAPLTAWIGRACRRRATTNHPPRGARAAGAAAAGRCRAQTRAAQAPADREPVRGVHEVRLSVERLRAALRRRECDDRAVGRRAVGRRAVGRRETREARVALAASHSQRRTRSGTLAAALSQARVFRLPTTLQRTLLQARVFRP